MKPSLKRGRLVALLVVSLGMVFPLAWSKLASAWSPSPFGGAREAAQPGAVNRDPLAHMEPAPLFV